jgi:hypothetical protein
MTTEETKALLVGTAEVLTARTLGAPVEGEPGPPERLSRLESIRHARRLVDYLWAVPADDPRLAAIARAVDADGGVEEFAERIPDEEMCPVEGPKFLDWFAGLAEGDA